MRQSVFRFFSKSHDIGKLKKHIIGEFEGQEYGPLLIVLAGMHGNEPAGVEALETIFRLLSREPMVNPSFHYKGKIVGLLGNVKAYREGKRMISNDLNRLWTPENIEQVSRHRRKNLHAEHRELRELLDVIKSQIESYQPERVIFLDLHTTSADGGIFAIATDDPESIRIAVELHAPVITGMLRGIHGTTLHYFNKDNCQALLNGSGSYSGKLQKVTGVAFEAGQHEDRLSANRCIAAIINCMRSIGSVNREDVENRHDEMLIEYSKDLPKIAELVKVHSIGPFDGFRMLPGYRNFQAVQRGEQLAEDRNGAIKSPDDGLILMPLYQPQGSDGFFIVKKIA